MIAQPPPQRRIRQHPHLILRLAFMIFLIHFCNRLHQSIWLELQLWEIKHVILLIYHLYIWKYLIILPNITALWSLMVIACELLFNRYLLCWLAMFARFAGGDGRLQKCDCTARRKSSVTFHFCLFAGSVLMPLIPYTSPKILLLYWELCYFFFELVYLGL